jgi:hypothetical protein
VDRLSGDRNAQSLPGKERGVGALADAKPAAAALKAATGRSAALSFSFGTTPTRRMRLGCVAMPRSASIRNRDR